MSPPPLKPGLAMFITEDGIGPGELAELAEDRGFESLFFPEHTHIPASRISHFAPERGELPAEYWHTLDPFVALTAAAAATKDLLVGTGICLVAQRDPITTAKEVATLDLLSGGRFLFGVGAGWNREEMANHGTDPRRRFALMADRMAAMKAIWTQDEASYEGEFTSFERIWSWPKPVQVPHPPVLVGGMGPTVHDRVLSYGDEWLPEPEANMVERIDELRRRADAEGRPEIAITVYSARAEEVDAYAAAGAHRAVFWLPPRDRQAALARLDKLSLALGL